MRWGLAEGSLARSKWWRRVVDAVGVEVAEVVVVVVVEVEVDLRAPSSSSLSSTLTSILLGFLLSISEARSLVRPRFASYNLRLVWWFNSASLFHF